MPRIDVRDVCVGFLLCLGGVWIAWYSYSNYNIGTIHQMGPGMFPMGLGLMLAVLGALIAGFAFLRDGALPEFELRAAISISASVAAFAMLLERVGLIPTVTIVTVIAATAGRGFWFPKALLMGIALALVSWVLFGWALGLSIRPYRWPSAWSF